MKKILVFAFVLITTINLAAQPPQGFGGGGRPSGSPRGEMGQRPTSSDAESVIILEFFPDIPDLTLEQREKIGSVLTKERKEITKQMENKRKIEGERKEDQTAKEREKNKKKIDKIDKKIEQTKEESNKKIKKELSEKQYLVFAEKRDDFKFKHQRGGRPNFNNGERPFEGGGPGDMGGGMFD